jgi:hypothetical protein
MKVGSKVICVDDSNWASHANMYFDKLPVKGCTYIVRRIIEDFVFNGTPGIALHTIYGNWSYWNSASGITMYEEAHFRMNRFREIEDYQIEQLLESAFISEEEVEVLQISKEPEHSKV